MNLGQVWSKADFDGVNNTLFQGGRGSVVAVCAQNPGPDELWDTADDINAPLNADPGDVSIDWPNLPDHETDRVRGFFSMHPTGANFGFADGSTKFISESIDLRTYRHLSTRNGKEILGEF